MDAQSVIRSNVTCGVADWPVAALAADDIMLELSDYLPSDELQGLETKIRAQLLQLCDALEEG